MPGTGEAERRGGQHQQIVSVTTSPWSKERDFSEKNEVTPSVYDLGLELANTKHEMGAIATIACRLEWSRGNIIAVLKATGWVCFSVMCFPEMAAELSASQKQVELHSTKLSTNGQQIEVLHTRLRTNEEQLQNLEAETEGNQSRTMFRQCM